ncbi:ABC transporter substrate-binding protein [Piscinibacter sp.]|uniref:ABC transporter substrate-binding protein n=1 Tax=Piscinibacter sp. TaxID=1903157 RepID=UPI001B5EE5C2|nr:ABC transporter substrate-binding protein [Piscinibacter sp.]MBK7533298.1 bicyclomycin resistance protein [Piscinibacter sp.]MBP6544242.1 bicyclomycin resistance protein [Piscinibacter sp.]
MRRRDWLGASAAWLALPAATARAAQRAAPADTLRVALETAETGFDPLAIGDENSNRVAACIFESPLCYDHVARPVKLRPLTAAALPEIGDDFRSFTFCIRPGIFFADDPAFKGRPRELVAQDYVYSLKRYYDPRNNSENLYVFENAGILDLPALRERALKDKTPFDYDREVEGLRALDRYTFRIRLAAPNPRFVYQFALCGLTGALAREVVEAYGSDIAAHPVGTGPYRLASWRRASRIELVRNPLYRERFFEGEPAEGDTQAQAIAAELAGRRLPLTERIEIHVVDEAQPRWLAFLNGAIDQIRVPVDFTTVALPGGVIAPNLARLGMRLQRALQPDMVMTYFNMLDPVVGGYTPDKVALRRAVALAYDSTEELRLVRHGQGVPAQSVVVPFTSGYDADYRSEMGDHAPARAKALLDLYGYVDRNGDGWRERPDGSPLVLRLSSTTNQLSRRLNELWRKNLAKVGLRIEFDLATWGDLLKRGRSASLMMWGYSWLAGSPDGGFFLGIAYGPNANESNDSRFSLPAFDRLFERQNVLPDGPEREALMREGKNMLVAHMPYKVHVHTITNDLLQPRVRGFWRHPFARESWIYTGVDKETPT